MPRGRLQGRRGRTGLVRRFRVLAILELFNAAFLPFVFYGLAGLPVTAWNVAGTVPALVFLVEGAGYWWVKGRQVARGAAHPEHLGIFARLPRLNVALLVAALVIVVVGLVAAPGHRSWPGAAFWVLALAEHVNYFHVQLMHDTVADLTRLRRRRRFGRSALARDLDRWRDRGHG